MEKLLREAATYLPHPRGGWEDTPARKSSSAAAGLRKGEAQAAPTQGGVGLGALRDLVLRLIKPLRAEAQIDQKLIDALDHLSNAVREINERNLAMEALTLHGLRDTERRLRAQLEADTKDNANRLADLNGDSSLAAEGPRHVPASSARAIEHEYNAAHADFVSCALEDSELLAKLANGGGLPQRGAWASTSA